MRASYLGVGPLPAARGSRRRAAPGLVASLGHGLHPGPDVPRAARHHRQVGHGQPQELRVRTGRRRLHGRSPLRHGPDPGHHREARLALLRRRHGRYHAALRRRLAGLWPQPASGSGGARRCERCIDEALLGGLDARRRPRRRRRCPGLRGARASGAEEGPQEASLPCEPPLQDPDLGRLRGPLRAQLREVLLRGLDADVLQ
mmetsp:Transcript_142631/g.355510  ORF Transcript_142631/g.355510 Transcript_142631/m.355510 type:complete len:202 (+) Transcript_142631:302-907(+)